MVCGYTNDPVRQLHFTTYVHSKKGKALVKDLMLDRDTHSWLEQLEGEAHIPSWKNLSGEAQERECDDSLEDGVGE